jgi:TolB protein
MAVRVSPRHRSLCGAFILCLFGVVLPAAASAQVVIDIFGPSIPRFPICAFPFRGDTGATEAHSDEALRILNQDLRISGFFEILEPAKALADPFRSGLEPQQVDWDAIRLLGADIVAGGRMAMEEGQLRWEARVYDQPQRRMLFGKIYRGNPQDVRIMVHRFVDEIIRYYTGAPGIFQTQMAFISTRTGQKELFVMDVDGENPRRLTQDNNLVLSPRWSPDGREVAFISYTGANAHLFGLDVKDLKRRLISGRENLNGPGAFSPDGGKLAVTLSFHGNPELYLLDRSGAILQRLTQHPGIDISPSWSPDGRSLAFVSDRGGGPQVYILDVGSGQSRRLTFEGTYNSEPAWSPRGDRVAFTSLIGGNHEICTIRPDGRDLVRLTTAAGNDNFPTWSPDGRYLAFSSTRTGSSQVYIMLFNGANQIQVSRMLGEQSSPSWSPWLKEP